MIVDLTRGQYNACRSVALRHSTELSELVERGDPGYTDSGRELVDLPYVAWALVLRLLMNVAWNERRWQGGTVPSRFTAAMQHIAAGINEIERHPALRDQALLGHWATTIPAWDATGYRWASADTLNPWRTHWAPLPLPGRTMVLLRPVWGHTGKTKITRWSAVEGLAPDDHWTHRHEAVEALEQLTIGFLIVQQDV